MKARAQEVTKSVTGNKSIEKRQAEKKPYEKRENIYQKLDDNISIYPKEYFSPYDYINCYSKANENTYTIHHFYKSWLPYKEKIKENIKKMISRIIGGHRVAQVRRIITKY